MIRRILRWSLFLLGFVFLSIVGLFFWFHRPFPDSRQLKHLKLAAPARRPGAKNSEDFTKLRYNWKDFQSVSRLMKSTKNQLQWPTDPSFVSLKFNRWNAISSFFWKFLRARQCITLERSRASHWSLRVRIFRNIRNSVQLLVWRAILQAQLGQPEDAAKKLLELEAFTWFMHSRCPHEPGELSLLLEALGQVRNAFAYISMIPDLKATTLRVILRRIRRWETPPFNPLTDSIQMTALFLQKILSNEGLGKGEIVFGRWPWYSKEHTHMLIRQYAKALLYRFQFSPGQPEFWTELPELHYLKQDTEMLSGSLKVEILLSFNILGRYSLHVSEVFSKGSKVGYRWMQVSCLHAALRTQLRDAWRAVPARHRIFGNAPLHPWTKKPFSTIKTDSCALRHPKTKKLLYGGTKIQSPPPILQHFASEEGLPRRRLQVAPLPSLEPRRPPASRPSTGK